MGEPGGLEANRTEAVTGQRLQDPICMKYLKQPNSSKQSKTETARGCGKKEMGADVCRVQSFSSTGLVGAESAVPPVPVVSGSAPHT